MPDLDQIKQEEEDPRDAGPFRQSPERGAHSNGSVPRYAQIS